MNFRLKKILSLILCAVMMFAFSSAIPVYAIEESADFCKIQNDSGRTSFRVNDKFSLSADYYCADVNATLLWTIDGESIFIDGTTEKTETGPIAMIHFLGDTNIKLQLVSQDGEVISEDEISIETLPEKTFFESAREKLVSIFLTFWVVVIGVIGGTFGPLFGGIIN